jgi:hypothetical protein
VTRNHVDCWKSELALDDEGIGASDGLAVVVGTAEGASVGLQKVSTWALRRVKWGKLWDLRKVSMWVLKWDLRLVLRLAEQWGRQWGSNWAARDPRTQRCLCCHVRNRRRPTCGKSSTCDTVSLALRSCHELHFVAGAEEHGIVVRAAE